MQRGDAQPRVPAPNPFLSKASALQSLLLAFHVLHDDVVDLTQAGAVFQHLPGLVGVEVDLDQFIIADSQQWPSG